MLLLVSLLALSAPASEGSVIYLSSRERNFDLYRLDLATRKETRLTDAAGWDWYARWSPALKRIIYLSKIDGKTQVWSMSADGSDKVATQLPPEQSLTLSPDATRAVYTNDQTGNWEVYTCDPDGSNAVMLTRNDAYEGRPSWSPNGRQILFISERDGNNEVYLMNKDGSDQQRLTNTPAREKYTAWSPDGKQIAFTSERDNEQGEIYIYDLASKQTKRITNNKFEESEIFWSPKGILIHSKRDGTDEIYLMSLDKPESWERLTNNSSYEGEPLWVP